MVRLNQSEKDIHWMMRCIELAKIAEENGDVPVGCLILDPNGALLAEGYNERELLRDPTAHAEIITLRRAASKQNTWRLLGCTMYVTLEPCFMCAGALVHARLKRVVFGAYDKKTGAVNSLAQVLSDARLNHQCEVHGGLIERECSQLLSDFFRRKRK